MLSKVTLGEISINNRGYYGIGASAVPYSESLFTYLRITDINDDGTLNTTDLKSVDDPDAPKYLLKPNDIVFARTGASTGRNYFYDGTDGELVYAGFLIKFSIDEMKVNPRFIKYYALSKPYRDWIASFQTGSTRGNINAQTLSEMPIFLPDREYQDKAISILDSITNKINSNNQINKNLVEQAISLYSHMFIENFSPEWKEGTLSEIATITMGQSPKGDTYNEDGDGTVFYQGRAEFGFRFPTRRLFTTDPKRMAEENDVLMSVRAPVGDYNVATERCCIGRGLASIRSLDNHQSFVLYSIHFAKQQLDVFNGEGTVFGSINRDGLNSLSIVIPDREAMDKFETIASAIDKKIRCNQEEIIRLQSLRDSLLPKLMSGEIDVSEINI